MRELLRWSLVVLSVPLLVVLVRQTVRRARDLSERIDRYHEEQEERRNTPGPKDPYADLAALFDAEGDKEPESRE